MRRPCQYMYMHINTSLQAVDISSRTYMDPYKPPRYAIVLSAQMREYLISVKSAFLRGHWQFGVSWLAQRLVYRIDQYMRGLQDTALHPHERIVTRHNQRLSSNYVSISTLET